MWNITFANGITLKFVGLVNKLYQPVLGDQNIPLLLEEWQCAKAFDILSHMHISTKLPEETFTMLIIGALRVSMNRGMV
jgi:hypothetical protein